MRRLTRWLLVAVAAVVVLTIAAMAVLPWIVDTRRVQSLIAGGAAQALARPVKFQSLSVSVLPYPAIRLGQLEIAEDPSFGGGAFLKLDEADLRLKLWSLLRGRVEFATLVLKRPTIALVQGADGRWNFASLGGAREPSVAGRAPRTGAGAAPPATLVSRIVVAEGLVTYEIRTAAGGAAPGRLEKVDLTLATRPGALGFSGSAHAMPGEVALRITEGTLGLSGARTLAEASVRARVALDGKDVRPVVAALLGPEPAVSGALTGRLSISGTVGRPRAAGEVELQSPEVMRTNPGCPEPRRRKLVLSTVKAGVSWDDGRLLVQPLATGIGGGSITSKVTATVPPPTDAELSDVVLRGVPLDKVLVDFLCQPYAVTGPLDLTGSFALTPSDLVRTLAGAGQFRIGQGKVVGPRALALLGGLARVGGAVSSVLSLDVPAMTGASPLDFEAITGTFQLRNGVATTRDLVYVSRAMKVRVMGDYALPTSQMNLDVVLDHGRGQLQAKVTGSAASPAIRVAPAAIVRQVDPARVERGVRDVLKKFR